MKNLLLLFIAILIFSFSLTAQNVGINQPNPTAKLDVNGNMKISFNNSIEFGAGVSPKEINAGKIGYGTITPGELDIVGGGTTSNRKIKLWSEAGTDFTGAINIESGKLTHNNTGAANLLPYAYGTVNISGVILNGTSNFTVTKYGVGVYGISLANSEAYSLNVHTASATVVGSGPPSFATTTAGIVAPVQLLIGVYDANGNLTDREVSFMIYKP